MTARLAVATLLLLGLGACSQADAPSREMEQAAQKVVAAMEGEAPQPAVGPFAPRNECAELPGAAQFLRDLNAAVAERDGDALASLAAEDIKLDFGGGGGIAQLRRRLAEPGGGMWDVLADLTELGCAQNSQGGLTLPWYFEQPLPVADAFAAFIVTGEDVALRSAPTTSAPVIVRLDWAAVELVPGEAAREGFRHVRVVDRPGPAAAGDSGPRNAPPVGYVAEASLRSLVAYRLTAASRNGRWRIISLVEGD